MHIHKQKLHPRGVLFTCHMHALKLKHLCMSVCMCIHAFENEPLVVIHREDVLTGLTTTERIGKKPPGAVCVCVNICL